MTAGRHETAEAAEAPPPARRWRQWRRRRPFTAGVLVALGGAEMLLTLRAPLGVLLHVGPQGLAAYLVPVVLVLCGVLLIATPQQRVFYALLTLVLGLVSWLTSNLGGFLVGMLLALVGGALAFAWTPAKPPRAARAAPVPQADETPAPAPGPPAQTGPAQAEARVGMPEAAPGDRP
ncbi:DUF6114 domain-containing protein [Micromonospora chaiyaphumensis]|uniref:Integral membrane protein n=1 Tax=Micromonospora chaiyaphumensis TaxID=307119 RepID=A0A1C4UXF2_9ACTN|nr:DUF6114 domain-containing protein [Micromonospora chaiyaphumensis]SCE76364.1 hypothetical protein GA0070214_1011105 [Micromonospora chaiyaphumensis]